MSKTSQRKRQAYEEGLRHGRARQGEAYRRHPFMEHYRNGYRDGSNAVKPVNPTMIQRLVNWFRSLTG